MAVHYTLRTRLTSLLIIGFGRAMTLIPISWALGIGAAVGWAVGWFLPFRRGVIDANLAAAFPEMTRRDRRRMRRRIWVSMGRWFTEQFYVAGLDTVKRGTFAIEEHREHLDATLAEGGGFIVVSAHLGNFQLGAAHFARSGLPFNAVAQPLHNGYLNDRIARERAEAGIKILYTGSDLAREICDLLHAGEIVTLIADADARQSGTFVEFFGRPASTPRGPAMFALRTGKLILPVFTVRERGATHRLVYGEPIRPPEDPEDPDQAIQELTQAHTRALEELIRRFPEQYFWFHRRWKTRPEDLRPKRRRRAGLEA